MTHFLFALQCGPSLRGGLRPFASQSAVEKNLRRNQRSVCGVCRHYQQDSTFQWEGVFLYGLFFFYSMHINFILISQFVPILLVLSTSSLLLLDQRTLQIKYRVPASEIYRMSLSPYLDDIAVFHVKAVTISYLINLFRIFSIHIPLHFSIILQSELGRKKGDFVFQTAHVIEIVTKMFLVIQNATGKPPEIHISTE